MSFNKIGNLKGIFQTTNYNRTNQQQTTIIGHKEKNGKLVIDSVRVQDQATENTVQNQPKTITSEEVLKFMKGQSVQSFSQPRQQEKAEDPREAEVAKKLGVTVEDFHKLPEDQKQQMVAQYNQEHPNDRIPEKLR